MAQISFPPFAVSFDTLVKNLIIILFHMRTGKIRAVHSEQTFMSIKAYLAHDIEGHVSH